MYVKFSRRKLRVVLFNWPKFIWIMTYFFYCSQESILLFSLFGLHTGIKFNNIRCLRRFDLFCFNVVIIIIYHSLESILLHSVTYLVNGIMRPEEHFKFAQTVQTLVLSASTLFVKYWFKTLFKMGLVQRSVMLL